MAAYVSSIWIKSNDDITKKTLQKKEVFTFVNAQSSNLLDELCVKNTEIYVNWKANYTEGVMSVI